MPRNTVRADPATFSANSLPNSLPPAILKAQSSDLFPDGVDMAKRAQTFERAARKRKAAQRAKAAKRQAQESDTKQKSQGSQATEQ